MSFEDRMSGQDTPVANPISQEDGTAYITLNGESFGRISAVSFGDSINAKRRERQACCACTTLGAVFIFLMLFFLIPRTPSLWLNDIVFVQSDDTTASSTKGKFIFQNRNYFGVKWKDVEVKLFWLPDDDQFITFACALSTNTADVCEFYYRGFCAIPLGEFENSDKFETNSRQSVKRSLTLTQTNQELACSAQVIVAGGGALQRLLTKGTVHAESSTRNFGKVHASDTIYSYF